MLVSPAAASADVYHSAGSRHLKVFTPHSFYKSKTKQDVRAEITLCALFREIFISIWADNTLFDILNNDSSYRSFFSLTPFRMGHNEAVWTSIWKILWLQVHSLCVEGQCFLLKFSLSTQKGFFNLQTSPNSINSLRLPSCMNSQQISVLRHIKAMYNPPARFSSHYHDSERLKTFFAPFFLHNILFMSTTSTAMYFVALQIHCSVYFECQRIDTEIFHRSGGVILVQIT